MDNGVNGDFVVTREQRRAPRFDGEVLPPSRGEKTVFDLLWYPRPSWWRPYSRRQWDRALRARRDRMREQGFNARFWQ